MPDRSDSGSTETPGAETPGAETPGAEPGHEDAEHDDAGQPSEQASGRPDRPAKRKPRTARVTTPKRRRSVHSSAADAGTDLALFTPEESGTDQGDAAAGDSEGAPEQTSADSLDRAPRDDSTAEATEDGDEDGDADSVDQDDPAAPAPFAAAFGLLFQAPQAPTRRASRPARAPEISHEEGEGVPDEIDDRASAQPPKEAATEDGQPDDSDATTGRTRRRRGGRGRRARTEGEDAPSEPDADTVADEAAPEPVEGAESPEPEDSSTGARRRRRRRRSGAAGEEDDPPGTVTKVRESRRDRDEPQSIKGSTRLEAKKLRRREGREAGRRRTIITEKEFLARRESVERTMVVRRIDGRTQIAVLEDGILVEHYVSRTTNASIAGNVYLGRVQNVLPSMEAAFVDIGRGRNAVLYAGEVNWDSGNLGGGEARRIENVLSSGESVLVQVTKDPIGHKGARLTSQISLPGRYLVYVPEGKMTGISRKLPDTERTRLKSILREVVPADAGVIVRTAAEGASEEELRRDVERLARAWEKISAASAKASKKKAGSGGAPSLLYAEPDLTVRVIRDVFNEDFASLVIAGEEVWQEISGYVQDVAPDLAGRMSKWTSEQDIFAAHRVDEQLAKALDRKVYLPSGGSLVIDRTEAMTVIDVNTGRFVGSGGNLEETVTKNNLEAAEEIVRQLRLRDMGGIIVIDFIDMVLESNRELVVRRLLECLGRDRTKHQVAEVTSLGLVQMTRKRVASGLLEVFSETCDHCEGRGVIVHAMPVDKSAGTSGGEQAAPAGRGRRTRAAEPEPAEPVTPKGPTAAQIAAAAHAAAIKSLNRVELPVAEAEEISDVDLPPEQAAPLGPGAAESASGEQPASDLATGDSGATVDSAVADPADHPADHPAGSADVPTNASPADAADPDAADPDDADPEAAEHAQDKGGEPSRGRGRRRRGRATAPAGPPPAPADPNPF
ncbi:MAG: Rne/Rng family ribonuclease [Tetrasphaera sp.]